MAHAKPPCDLAGGSVPERRAGHHFGRAAASVVQGAPVTAAGPKVLAREVLTAGYLSVRRLRIRLKDAAIVTREVVSFGDAVAVLPYDAARCCALTVRLFRPAVFEAAGSDALEEACAGMRDGDEVAEQAARREALEELGLALGPLESVAEIWSSPGVSTERLSLFLAPFQPTDRVSPGGGLAREHEAIEVLERPLAELGRQADDGLIQDAKLLILVQALRRRRPDLFAEAPAAG
jgi:nudix-type nucleoside diphosphatase (YffH/AdpP family)